jgi:expansin (peptidoglycan-binding protein)
VPPTISRALIALIAVLALGAAGALAQEQSRLYLPLLTAAPRPTATPISPTPSPTTEPPAQNPTFTGEGTYYFEADGGGNCMFDPTPGDLMVGAMNETQYANADLCGAYVELTGPKGTITVRIVDRCPECQPGDIDLSTAAFDRIAERIQGRVPISWRVISPALASPIAYRFKEGSNQWWTAVQVRNHRNPIAKLEYRNFVEPAGMGPGPYTFRVTDIYGNVLTDSGIPHTEGGSVDGAGQFPPGP